VARGVDVVGLMGGARVAGEEREGLAAPAAAGARCGRVAEPDHGPTTVTVTVAGALHTPGAGSPVSQTV
jgi:hypothetical protein